MTDFFASGFLWWPVFILAALGVAAARPTRFAGFVIFAVLLIVFSTSHVSGGMKALLWVLYGVAVVVLWFGPFRRLFISNRLLAFYRASMPELSSTEREALEAGTVWWDGELFSGAPHWQALLDLPPPKISAEEQAFLDGPVEQLCGMLDDHRICNVDKDLTPETWRFIKERGFFGMMISKQYGGMAFSNMGHAAVILKIASRSISAALTVMIPNSVGPGKLLLKYGTEAQKDHWLPRLARGEEIPCFALTGPEAGSDAGAIPDIGVVCRDAKGTLGIRLNFEKRYISMGPIATVLGVAFKLEDPDHLLGEKTHLGITLALVPAKSEGVKTGTRHDQLHMAFMNGPLFGKDVFVPMDLVIGGPEMAGKGWRMLVESLTDGRAISLPALSTATAKLATRVTSAYARIRRQFKLPISQFEGIRESIARLVGNTYAMDGARLTTLAALDAGHKPAVISAIVKYNLTERSRQVMQDAMDVHGGAALAMGPRNPLGQFHSFPQLGTTVEGHNILTRNLITFGQGAIRCHPYLLKELQAAANPDKKAARREFDKVVMAHLAFAANNKARAFLHGLTGGAFIAAPTAPEALKGYYQQLTRMSAAFAFVTDVLLLTLRGELKRRERLSARMADIISQLYIASTALKHYHDQGNQPGDLPLVSWVCEDSLYRIQQSFDALFKNLPKRWIAFSLRLVVFPLGRSYKAPSDALEHQLAAAVLRPSAERDRLTAGMYLPPDMKERVRLLDEAFQRAVDTRGLREKLRAAAKDKTLQERGDAQIDEAVQKSVITAGEASALRGADALRREAIKVDDYPDLRNQGAR
ncbi:MAG TPA: acyl-CoA dehydrogenase [Gammaproteobacteria bacterium]|jgi:acyl-CoA dehydrogenase